MIDEQQGNDPVDVQRLRQFDMSSITPCISPVSGPSRQVGWQQAAQTWHRSMVAFNCSVISIVRGFQLKKLHPVCCIRDLVLLQFEGLPLCTASFHSLLMQLHSQENPLLWEKIYEAK